MYWVLTTQLVLVPVVRSLATYIVAVGRDGLVFSPSEIVAQVDDLIQYQFYPGNFSVVQSSFESPCERLLTVPDSAAPSRGFYSGFMPTAVGSDTIATYTVSVVDTMPVYVFCSQQNYCSRGMVMTINAPVVGETYDAFELAAISSDISPQNASTSTAFNASVTLNADAQLPQNTELPSSAQKVDSARKAVWLFSYACLFLIL